MPKKNKTSFVNLGLTKSRSNDSGISSREQMDKVELTNTPGMRQRLAVRNDSLGHNPDGHIDDSVKIESLCYQGDESDVLRAYNSSRHYLSRGKWWNDGKREKLIRYINLTLVGLCQGTVAYFTNYYAKTFIDVSHCYLILSTNFCLIKLNMILTKACNFRFVLYYRIRYDRLNLIKLKKL